MRDIQLPGRSVVMSTHGMIATSQPMATHVGLDILKRGGNAMDAAIAAGAALCVTEPYATGIGGDCFILYHEGRSGKLYGLNGSGRAPKRASLEAFETRGLKEIPLQGILPVSVPGAVDAWQTALERFGTKDFAELFQPAIDYAEEGYVVSPVVAQVWKEFEPVLAAYPGMRHTFLVNGKAPAAGTVHRQSGLAKSLRLIAQQGKNALYNGELAEAIVRFSHEQDGLLELDDFAEHHSEWVAPISTEYRGVQLHEIPPNGQGITALMMLNILKQASIDTLQPLGPDHIHLFAEAFKLAAAERDKYVCDPAFSSVPVGGLLDKDFSTAQWARIDPDTAAQFPLSSALTQHRDTVCLSVVDKERNAVSFINSLYHPFGSCMSAGETGIVLQNRGAGFVLQADHLNCIAPAKRPKHTIIPAMATGSDGSLLCFGVMGGEYQAMGHAYVLSNWLDFGMDLQQAIDAPRFLPEQGKLVIERGIPDTTRAELEQRGHTLVTADTPHGGAQAIYIDGKSDVLFAASDPRKDGCAMGY